MFTPRHPQTHYHLHHHRLASTHLTDSELIEVRAAQRTFEGAYIRTSLSQFSFALVVLKIFTSEFYGTGALFAVYGASVMVVGWYRRREGQRAFFEERHEVVEEDVPWQGSGGREGGGGQARNADNGPGTREGQGEGHGENILGGYVGRRGVGTVQKSMFRTSGNVVVVLTGLSVAAYVSLLVLTLRLDS